jgi:hypothetical protein
MYAGVEMGEYALAIGKQSLWLSPTQMAPLMVGDNADPMYAVQFSRTTPLVLPSFLKFLGAVRGEVLFAKLSGHQFPARPFFNLQKVSFHPTENLELGFTRSSLWSGVGHPFTARSLLRNFGSFSSSVEATFSNRADPGDRKAGFDFSYKVPGLRHWLRIYSDFYSDDDPSPLANPRRAALNPGIYLSHTPSVPKLDLRVEATSTQLLTSFDLGPRFLYYNEQYHEANTNKGELFGNQTGRDGRSYQGWATYHFSAVSDLGLSYREIKTSNVSVPGGGTQNDGSARLRWCVRPDLVADAFVQYERWLMPFVRPGIQHDITGELRLTFNPHLELHNN